MFLITGALLFVAVAITITDWRRGPLVAISVALLQDPLRKLTPGEPIIYVLLVGVVIAAGVIGAAMSGVSLMPNRIWGWRRYLATPFGFFLAIIALQGLNSLIRFQNVMLPALGVLNYLVPFIAMVYFYQIFNKTPEQSLNRYMSFYIAFIIPAFITVCLEYFGFNLPIFGEVGIGIRIYDQGTVMAAHSGIFRASEIAAWHVATAVCFIIILFVSQERNKLSNTLLVAGLVMVLIGIGMLTGRRKFIMQIIIFASVYTSFLLYFGRGAAKLAITAVIAGFMGFVAFTALMPEEKRALDAGDAAIERPYDLYVERTKTVFGDAPQRLIELGYAPISWAYNQYGVMGGGLGVGSQGANRFGISGSGAAEGGFGKIWLELGGIGFLVVAWLGWSFVQHLWEIIKLASRQSVKLSRTAYGLAGFLVANFATFTVATQAYADIFILTILGMALAALLAMPVLLERRSQERLVSDLLRMGVVPPSSPVVPSKVH